MTSPTPEETERDLDAYGRLVELWTQENPIKTNKLQVLLAVNGLLLTGLQLSGVEKQNWPLCAAGAVFSAIWMFSIGRTVLFQKIWQIKIRDIRERHKDDVRFQVLETDEAEKRVKCSVRLFGGISSRYYLLYSPLMFTLGWLVALVVLIAK